jgi:hypothetical protein
VFAVTFTDKSTRPNGAGAIAVGGAIAGIAYAATTERSPDQGDAEPGIVSAPIIAARRSPIPLPQVPAVKFWLPAIRF